MIILDIDPSNASSIVLSGSSVQIIDDLVGAGHQPTLNETWALGIPTLNFSGSTTYTDKATQYLYVENDALYNATFSCTSGTWATWSIFLVVQLASIPVVEAAILSVNQAGLSAYPGSGNPANIDPLVFLYASNTHFGVACYSDGLASSNGSSIGVSDTNAHLIEISADGTGTINAWFDGVLTTFSDVRPKTAGSLTLGASWYASPLFIVEQLNANIARAIVYNTNLVSSERTKVRNLLRSKYGV